eukprot:c24113_g2_i2 orf=1158-2831(+)
MNFSQSSLPVSAGLSTGSLSFGERSVSNLTTQVGECRHQLRSPGASDMLSPNNPFKQCMSTSDMNVDSTADHNSGPMKLARTDSFSGLPDLEMQMGSRGSFGSVVRTSSVVSDGCIGCSSTNTTVSNAVALLCNEASLMPEARPMRSDSIATCPPGSVSSYHHAYPFGPLGLSRPMGGETVNLMGLHETTHLGIRPPFTMQQYRELRHQLLIFKYISNGMTVPADLLIPIRNSLFGLGGIVAAHHQQLANIGWGNYHIGFASNTDPEPGRCRRTDGKKWRCSREVVPDQKYCERHMHRGRHRARKAVDTQTPSASSVMTVATPSSGSASSVNLAAALGTTPGDLGVAAVMNNRQYRPVPNLNLQCYSSRNSSSGIPVAASINSGGRFQLPLQSLGGPSRDYGFVNVETKLQAALGTEQMLFAESSGSARGFPQDPPPSIDGLSMLSSVSNSWRNSIPSKQHSFLGSGFGAAEAVSANPEQEGHPLRHFFDDWPRSTTPGALSWSNADDERSNRSSSATQLSISLPMISSDFTAANAGSPREKGDAGIAMLETSNSIE